MQAKAVSGVLMAFNPVDPKNLTLGATNSTLGGDFWGFVPVISTAKSVYEVDNMRIGDNVENIELLEEIK